MFNWYPSLPRRRESRPAPVKVHHRDTETQRAQRTKSAKRSHFSYPRMTGSEEGLPAALLAFLCVPLCLCVSVVKNRTYVGAAAYEF